MKINKLIITLALVIIPFITNAQSQFDKFEDMEGVSSVIVGQKAFELMMKIGSESDKEYMDLINGIKSLKVFATKDNTVAAKMTTEVSRYLKTANLEELMRANDDGNNVKIYIKEGSSADYVKELFMFVKSKNEENVIISLTGNINLKQISKLTDKMHIPGGEHLRKVSK